MDGAIPTAGAISARIDRLPATRTIWTMLALLGFGMFIAALFTGLFGAPGVFVFIAAAMAVVMAVIGIFGPRATNLALETIAH